MVLLENDTEYLNSVFDSVFSLDIISNYNLTGSHRSEQIEWFSVMRQSNFIDKNDVYSYFNIVPKVLFAAQR